MTNTLSKSGIAAKTREVLDHERWANHREALDRIDAELRNMGMAETNGYYAMLLLSAASEVANIANDYSDKIKAHDKLRRDLKASLAMEEGK